MSRFDLTLIVLSACLGLADGETIVTASVFVDSLNIREQHGCRGSYVDLMIGSSLCDEHSLLFERLPTKGTFVGFSNERPYSGFAST